MKEKTNDFQTLIQSCFISNLKNYVIVMITYFKCFYKFCEPKPREQRQRIRLCVHSVSDLCRYAIAKCRIWAATKTGKKPWKTSQLFLWLSLLTFIEKSPPNIGFAGWRRREKEKRNQNSDIYGGTRSSGQLCWNCPKVRCFPSHETNGKQMGL